MLKSILSIKVPYAITSSFNDLKIAPNELIIERTLLISVSLIILLNIKPQINIIINFANDLLFFY